MAAASVAVQRACSGIRVAAIRPPGAAVRMAAAAADLSAAAVESVDQKADPQAGRLLARRSAAPERRAARDLLACFGLRVVACPVQPDLPAALFDLAWFDLA